VKKNIPVPVSVPMPAEERRARIARLLAGAILRLLEARRRGRPEAK